MTATRGLATSDYDPGALDGYDLVIVGPGPGDPREGDHPKIAAFRAATEELLASGQPFLASAWGTRCSATGSGSPLPTRTSSSRARSRASTSRPRADVAGRR